MSNVFLCIHAITEQVLRVIQSGYGQSIVHHPAKSVLVIVHNVHHQDKQAVVILKILHWTVVNTV